MDDVSFDTEYGTMDAVFQHLKGGGRPDIYNELALVYDFIWGERFYDYDRQAEQVRTHAPDGAGTFVELACGTGRALRRLADEFDEVYGVEKNEGMARIARERVPSVDVELADMTAYEHPEPVDCIAVLGYSLGALSRGDVRRLFEQCYGNLADEGRVLVEHLDGDAADGSFYEVSRTHPSGYEVVLRSISVVRGDTEKNVNAYELVDDETGEVARGGEVNDWTQHPTDLVREAMEQAGLDVETGSVESDVFGYGDGVLLVGVK